MQQQLHLNASMSGKPQAGSRFENVTRPLPGFEDAVGKKLSVMRYIEAELGELFREWGYGEIRVPIVERASSFSEEVIGGSPWPEWDKRGVFYLHLQSYQQSYGDLPAQEPALLVPEGTISVSRWLADVYSRGEFQAPRKLSYTMPCFRNELISKLSETKGRQFHQAGVEILGSNEVRADLEVLLLAREGFLRVGVAPESILVRIGSVGLFNAVCAETGLDESDILTVKDLMDTIAESRAGKLSERLDPSITRVLDLVAACRPSDAVTRKWQLMVGTRVELLDEQFIQVVGHEAEVDALNFLASTARSLGVGCVIDPSVVRSHEYYTGIVYEIDITSESGAPLVEVAGGGRYNKLIGKFLGAMHAPVAVPAVGFAYGLERVVEIVLGLPSTTQNQRRAVQLRFSLGDGFIDRVVCDRSDSKGSGVSTASKLRSEGYVVDYFVGDDQSTQAVQAYAERLGAEVVVA